MADDLPRLLPVESSNIDAVAYDAATRRLYVRFLASGATYVYFEVPKAVFEEFLDADSKGRFLNAQIRDAYEYRRL